MVVLALSLILAFLVGGIPFGVVLARRRGVDLRESGSGNIGATNAARALGLGAGLLVLVLDAVKGALAVTVAKHVIPDLAAVEMVGFSAIAGHCFSPFLGFRGGKGVATTLGVFVAVSPPLALIGIAVFAAVASRTRIVALGSLAGVAAAALTATLAYPEHRTLALATLALLVYTHRTNLARLVRPD